MLYRVYQRNGHTDRVEADMIRMHKTSGDMWFCDNNDVGIDGNFQPKFVVASGEYLKVKKIDGLNAKETEMKYANKPDKPPEQRANLIEFEMLLFHHYGYPAYGQHQVP